MKIRVNLHRIQLIRIAIREKKRLITSANIHISMLISIVQENRIKVSKIIKVTVKRVYPKICKGIVKIGKQFRRAHLDRDKFITKVDLTLIRKNLKTIKK